jgi:hypothetical protein
MVQYDGGHQPADDVFDVLAARRHGRQQVSLLWSVITYVHAQLVFHRLAGPPVCFFNSFALTTLDLHLPPSSVLPDDVRAEDCLPIAAAPPGPGGHRSCCVDQVLEASSDGAFAAPPDCLSSSALTNLQRSGSFVGPANKPSI